MHVGRGVAELSRPRIEDAEMKQSGLGTAEVFGHGQLELALGTMRACGLDQRRAALVELRLT